MVRPSKVNKQFQPLDKRNERWFVVHGGDNKTNEKPYSMVQKYVCTTEVDKWVYYTRLKPQTVSDLSPFFHSFDSFCCLLGPIQGVSNDRHDGHVDFLKQGNGGQIDEPDQSFGK